MTNPSRGHNMSIDFFVTDGKSERVPVPCGGIQYEECSSERRCGFCTDGTTEEEVYQFAPINFNNSSALALIGILGLDDTECCGSVPAEEVATLRQRIMVLRNSPQRRSPAHREGGNQTRFERAVETEGNVSFITERQVGPTVIMGGLDDAAVLQRLNRLDTLFEQAQSIGSGVHWG